MSTAFPRHASWLMILALAGCAHAGRGGAPLSSAELAALASGQTLHITPVDGGSAGVVGGPCVPSQGGCLPGRVSTVYLAPNGGGWVDYQPRRFVRPWTGTMAMITAWDVRPPSTLCITSAPLIGDMPSIAPSVHSCMVITKSPAGAPAPLTALVTQGHGSFTGYITAYPGNEFSASLTGQYIDMVKALYGQQIPTWPDG